MGDKEMSVPLVHGNDAPPQKKRHIKEAESGPLSALFKEKVRPCIDLVDSLRALGVENDLALPAIAVIGDQSSGKSSVLEALSGVALPRGSGIVTRCPLALKLKKLQHKSKWKGDIQYSGKTYLLTSPSEVEAAVIKAQDEIAGTGVGISHNLISLEISSPDVPDLTLIDLPGIARVAVDNQPQDIGQQIITLIKTYICKQETINLVVVPSNVDIATTEALKMAQEVDPQGERTLGILTKPDLVDKGVEQEVVNIVRNQRVPLRKGYMIVKCRGQRDIIGKMSLEKAIQTEKIFFEEHPIFSCLWKENRATIPVLAERLTEELIEHIIKSLPALENQIKDKLEVAHMQLQQYGQGVPETTDEQMLYLIEKIQIFNKSISEKVEGQEMLTDEQKSRMFARVRICFNKWQDTVNENALNVRDIVKEVSTFDMKYRGKELPGFTCYRTFQEIVKTNIEMLHSPAIKLLNEAADIVQQSFKKTANEKFNYFSHLHREVQLSIEDIITKQKEEAKLIINSQFDMEHVVYSQDSIYSNDLREVRNSQSASSQKFFNTLGCAQKCSVDEMAFHLHAYYKSAGIRIGTQIPMIIQAHMLHKCAEKLQTAVLMLLQNKDQYDFLLQEAKHIADKRTRVKEQISRLTKAQQCLAKFSI